MPRPMQIRITRANRDNILTRTERLMPEILDYEVPPVPDADDEDAGLDSDDIAEANRQRQNETPDEVVGTVTDASGNTFNVRENEALFQFRDRSDGLPSASELARVEAEQTARDEVTASEERASELMSLGDILPDSDPAVQAQVRARVEQRAANVLPRLRLQRRNRRQRLADSIRKYIGKASRFALRRNKKDNPLYDVLDGITRDALVNMVNSVTYPQFVWREFTGGSNTSFASNWHSGDNNNQKNALLFLCGTRLAERCGSERGKIVTKQKLRLKGLPRYEFCASSSSFERPALGKPWETGSAVKPWSLTLYDLVRGWRRANLKFPALKDAVLGNDVNQRGFNFNHGDLILQYALFGRPYYM